MMFCLFFISFAWKSDVRAHLAFSLVFDSSLTQFYQEIRKLAALRDRKLLALKTFANFALFSQTNADEHDGVSREEADAYILKASDAAALVTYHRQILGNLQNRICHDYAHF